MANGCNEDNRRIELSGIKTKQDRLRALKQSVPADYDNRRKSTQGKDLKEGIAMFGSRGLTATDDGYQHKLMTTSMYEYQVVAAGWMLKREEGSTSPRGGCLCDEPGTGKTVTTLSVIVGNQAHPEDLENYCKTTLVVVPNTQVASQWRAEIEKHCVSKVTSSTTIYDARDKRSTRWLSKRLIL